MTGMNNIALNDDVYEQLKNSCEQIKYEDPSIDIEEDIKRYVNTLKIDDKTVRESKLEAWISAKIQPKITQWKQKYSGANNLLNNIHTQINNMSKLLHTEQANINNIQNQITSKVNEKSLLSTELKNAEHDEVSSQKINLPYEKKMAITFIIFSIVIAFATYIYFVNNQISLKWATKSPQDKKSIIIKLVQQGDIGYINYVLKEHPGCFRDEDTDKVIALDRIKKTTDFSCINTNKLEDAPKPGLTQAFSEEPILFVLSFSAFLLMLMGKATAIVFEKLKYPNWLFYLFYGLAGVVLISTSVVSSSLSSLQIEKDQIVKQISSMHIKKNTIIKEYQDTHDPDEYEDDPGILDRLPEIQEIKKKIKEEEPKKLIVDEKISQFSFWISLLMMFTELVMGSIAWMTYSEYIKKKQEVEIGGQGRIKKLKEEDKDISNEVSKLEALIVEKQQRINKATDLQGKLSILLGGVHTNEQIENIAYSFEQSIIANGKSMLQEAQMIWYKEQYE